MTAADPRANLGDYAVTRGDPLTITLPFTKRNEDGSVSIVNLPDIATDWSADLRRSSQTSNAYPFAIDDTNAASGDGGKLMLSLTDVQTQAMCETSSTALTFTADLEGTGGPITPNTIGKLTVTIYPDYTWTSA